MDTAPPRKPPKPLLIFSVSGIVLAVFMMVAFQYLDLAHGHTNTGWVSNLALFTMFSNVIAFLICPLMGLSMLLSNQKAGVWYLLSGILNFIVAVWMFMG